MNPTPSQQAASASATPKTTTIERIARALGAADGVVWTEGYIQYRAADCPAYETLPEHFNRLAKAALQALRQVDEGTVEAMAPAMVEWLDGLVAGQASAGRNAFTAAIEKILEGDNGAA